MIKCFKKKAVGNVAKEDVYKEGVGYILKKVNTIFTKYELDIKVDDMYNKKFSNMDSETKSSVVKEFGLLKSAYIKKNNIYNLSNDDFIKIEKEKAMFKIADYIYNKAIEDSIFNNEDDLIKLFSKNNKLFISVLDDSIKNNLLNDGIMNDFSFVIMTELVVKEYSNSKR